MCTWQSSGWYCAGNAWYRCIVFRREEFDAWYLDWRLKRLTGCDALDDTDCKAVHDKEVVGIKTWYQETSSVDSKGESTPHWHWVGWGESYKTEGPTGEIHFTWCFGSMEGLSTVACTFFSSVGRHWWWQQHFWSMVRWMASQYFCGFVDFYWLRETFLPMLINKPVEYPEPDEDDPIREVLLLQKESHGNALPSTSPQQNAVQFCPFPGQVRHL